MLTAVILSLSSCPDDHKTAMLAQSWHQWPARDHTTTTGVSHHQSRSRSAALIQVCRPLRSRERPEWVTDTNGDNGLNFLLVWWAWCHYQVMIWERETGDGAPEDGTFYLVSSCRHTPTLTAPGPPLVSTARGRKSAPAPALEADTAVMGWDNTQLRQHNKTAGFL